MLVMLMVNGVGKGVNIGDSDGVGHVLVVV